jgi:hypothetical protein
MAYKPKSKRTNSPVGPQGKKLLDGLTANKNIDDIIALSKISNTQTTEIKNINSGLSKLSASVSSKQNKLTLTTTGSSGPATLNNDTLNVPDYSVSLSGFVPYTGATGDVDLGEHEIKAGQVEFDQTPTGTAGVAVMRWNDQDGTVDLGLKGGNVTLQVGQEQVTRVVNKTGINLLEANYQVVRIDGAQGNRLKVALAQANNDANSAETLGIVTETINDNQEGFVTTSGLVRGINTTGSIQGETWADGDMLYLSGTVAGLLTNIKPAAPIHTVIMGYVVRAHATQGQIYVKVDNGYELDELHNVAITSPSNGQTLVYDSATSLWKNGSSGSGGAVWGGITGTLSNQTDLQNALNAKENTITAGTTAQYYRGDKTFQTLDKTSVGLSNVDNTSDANKPISNATQTALNAKQNTLTLTTTGTSGAATLVGSTLNIPQYSGGGGGGSFGIHSQFLPGGSFNMETSNTLTGGSTGSYTTQANQMVYFPYIPNNNITSNTLAFNVTNAIASSRAKLYIYSHNGVNSPQTMLYESTEIDLSTSGMKTITTSFSFTKGTIYWFGIYSSVFGSAISGMTTAQGGLHIGWVGTSPILAWVQVSITYPTAPTTASPNSFQTTTPIIRIK